MIDNKKINIIFMGTPDFSVPVLEGLIENYNVIGVVTQPDRLVGRKQILTMSPVKEKALEYGIKVYQPEKIKDEVDIITNLKADVIITCAYGQILPSILLNYPKYGCINVHASLLPKLRGGAPIHHSIIRGYKKTGITIMYMSPKMDAGDIIKQKETEITLSDTASSLHNKLCLIGRDLLLDSLPSIINRTNERIKQDESEVTYAYAIKREDELLDFNKTKEEVYNQIRGLNSWPGSYTKWNEKILKVWSSRIGEEISSCENGTIIKIYKDGIGVKVTDGEIIFTEIQLEGKKKVSVKDFLNGTLDPSVFIGNRLG